MGVVCFLAMFASTKALDLILCKPAEVRMLQPILLFTSFSALIFVFYADRSRGRLKRYAGFVFAGLVILLQTQTINNFAVKNQERFYYEDDDLITVILITPVDQRTASAPGYGAVPFEGNQ